MKRVYVALSDELAGKIEYWSNRMEIAQTNLMAMSIQAGLGAILKAVYPEEAISPEILADIIRAVDAKGGLPGGENRKGDTSSS